MAGDEERPCQYSRCKSAAVYGSLFLIWKILDKESVKNEILKPKTYRNLWTDETSTTRCIDHRGRDHGSGDCARCCSTRCPRGRPGNAGFRSRNLKPLDETRARRFAL